MTQRCIEKLTEDACIYHQEDIDALLTFLVHTATSNYEATELKLDEHLEKQIQRHLEEPKARLLKGSSKDNNSSVLMRTVKLSDVLSADSDAELRQHVEASKMSRSPFNSRG